MTDVTWWKSPVGVQIIFYRSNNSRIHHAHLRASFPIFALSAKNSLAVFSRSRIRRPPLFAEGSCGRNVLLPAVWLGWEEAAVISAGSVAGLSQPPVSVSAWLQSPFPEREAACYYLKSYSCWRRREISTKLQGRTDRSGYAFIISAIYSNVAISVSRKSENKENEEYSGSWKAFYLNSNALCWKKRRKRMQSRGVKAGRQDGKKRMAWREYHYLCLIRTLMACERKARRNAALAQACCTSCLLFCCIYFYVLWEKSPHYVYWGGLRERNKQHRQKSSIVYVLAEERGSWRLPVFREKALKKKALQKKDRERRKKRKKAY